MTGDELRAIREQLGLSVYALGRLFGYRGKMKNIRGTVERYERGARTIPLRIERQARYWARRGRSVALQQLEMGVPHRGVLED